MAYLDASRLVSSSEDKTIRLWDAETGDNVFTLRGHINGVLGVACRPDGKQIASASVDQSFKIWEIEAPSRDALQQRREISIHRDARRAIWRGRPADALRALDDFAQNSPPSAETMMLRGLALLSLGKQAEAITLLEPALRQLDSKLGPDHPDTLITRTNLSNLYCRVGRWSEAEALMRDLLARRRKISQANSPELAGDLAILGTILLEQSKWSEAEPILRECLAIAPRPSPTTGCGSTP